MTDDTIRATLHNQAIDLLRIASATSTLIATAESCTGGLVAGAITEIAGSSAIFDRGFVTYSNDAKAELIGVPRFLIERYGAVSAEVACAMAEGALTYSRATLSVAITGIAGPGGGSIEKPVGLVHFATAQRGAAPRHHEVRFDDKERSTIRLKSVATALRLLIEALRQTS